MPPTTARGAARRHALAALVPARLPAHVRRPAWRRQALPDRPPPGKSGAATPAQRSRRPAASADRGDLEHPPRRLPYRAGEPAPPLLPGLRLRRLGGHRLLLRQPGLEGAHRPLQPLLRQALLTARVRRLQRRRPGLRAAADGLGPPPPSLQDACLLPGLRRDQLLPDPELPRQPRRAAQRDPPSGLPPLRAEPAEGPSSAGRRRRRQALTTRTASNFLPARPRI